MHSGIFIAAIISGIGISACIPDKELYVKYPQLPKRQSPRPATTGSVPHQQIDVDAVPEVNAELFRRAFSLPGVENRPSAFSLPGARGIWIGEEVQITRPDQIVSGREFAHIHPDGSLHASLPLDRALEANEAGWVESQPIAVQLGIPGLVMIYTPQTLEELETVLQLVVDSYNFVTGQNLTVSDLGSSQNVP
ncbi:MAG: phospholipase [Chloroflexi bacterium]|nr:phospholipase [Chloroflexota bacterium]